MKRTLAKITATLALSGAAAGVLGAAACGPAGFDPASDVQTVRVFAARADKPYAKPGDTVNVDLYAYDGRPAPTTAMKIYWLPFVCKDPPGDVYYACFSALLAGAGDGGAGEAGAGDGGLPPIFQSGFDITDFLVQGSRFTFKMPQDVITAHRVVQGAAEPYGIAFVFAIACAGRVRIAPIDPNNIDPQKVPIGCYDDQGNALGPDDYVIAFSRVYAYQSATNTNPEIDGVTFDGKPVDLNAGVVVDRCRSKNNLDCAHKFNVNVPDSSWELATGTPAQPDGTQLHEQVYAQYYWTLPQTTSDGRLLFDPSTGRVPDSDNKFLPPYGPSEGRIFVVVHDNRGGANWVDFPVYVR